MNMKRQGIKCAYVHTDSLKLPVWRSLSLPSWEMSTQGTLNNLFTSFEFRPGQKPQEGGQAMDNSKIHSQGDTHRHRHTGSMVRGHTHHIRTHARARTHTDTCEHTDRRLHAHTRTHTHARTHIHTQTQHPNRQTDRHTHTYHCESDDGVQPMPCRPQGSCLQPQLMIATMVHACIHINTVHSIIACHMSKCMLYQSMFNGELMCMQLCNLVYTGAHVKTNFSTVQQESLANEQHFVKLKSTESFHPVQIYLAIDKFAKLSLAKIIKFPPTNLFCYTVFQFSYSFIRRSGKIAILRTMTTTSTAVIMNVNCQVTIICISH